MKTQNKFSASRSLSTQSLYLFSALFACISVFSERELKFTFAMSSAVRLTVVCLSVTFVRPTQAIEIFGNTSTPCGTLAIHDLCVKKLRRSSQGKCRPHNLVFIDT